MFLQPAGIIRLRHGRYSQGFAKRDEEAIVALYRDNGFRDCKVTARTRRRLQGQAGRRRRHHGNRRGPAIHSRHDGRAGPQRVRTAAALMAGLASLPGQPFSETNVALDRDVILKALPIRRLSRRDVRLEARRRWTGSSRST